MKGVITRVQVLAHPIVIVESFGVKVFLRALVAGARETFLEIVSRCAEEEAHLGMDELPFVRTVKRFIGFECRVRDVYRRLADRFSDDPQAAEFFATVSRHEEGHAIVLSRVLREIRRGHLWKESKAVHAEVVAAFEARLEACEEEVRRGVTLARALDIVEGVERSEINVVFDTLNESVDMRSRTRFEQFFVLTQRHLAYCGEQIRALRARQGFALGSVT
jgi:rubrerythrin